MDPGGRRSLARDHETYEIAFGKKQALKQYPVEMWTTRLARRRYHFASQVAEPDSRARHGTARLHLASGNQLDREQKKLYLMSFSQSWSSPDKMG